MTAKEIVNRYYDAWINRAGDFSDVPFAEDFAFTGPVASFDSAEGYRQMAREAGRLVTRFEVRHQFVDGQRVCPIIDWEMNLPVAPMTSAAFRAPDVEALVRLLREDALLTMPPYPAGFEGPTAIGRFFATVPAGGRLDRILLVVTRANGQPALAAYGPAEDGRRHAYGVMVLTMQDDAISAITGFLGPDLLGYFALPASLEP